MDIDKWIGDFEEEIEEWENQEVIYMKLNEKEKKQLIDWGYSKEEINLKGR